MGESPLNPAHVRGRASRQAMRRFGVRLDRCCDSIERDGFGLNEGAPFIYCNLLGGGGVGS